MVFSKLQQQCDNCLDPSFNVECPPRMADGRLFTDYRPRCVVNDTLIDSNNKTMSSLNQRKHLTHNGEEIIKANMLNAMKSSQCHAIEPTDTQIPMAFRQTCDTNVCNFTRVDDTGLGLTR